MSIHPGPEQALGLLGHQPGSGRDDEDVVAEGRTVAEVHLVGLDVDVVDRRFDELDAVVQLPFARTHDVLGVRQPERHEQQTRLVDVPVVLVDHRDDGLVERRTGAAGGWRSACRRCRHRGSRCALVYHGPGQKAWEEVPKPTVIDDTDAIVRVDAVTICGTDLCTSSRATSPP